jgi:hypothetical protein
VLELLTSGMIDAFAILSPGANVKSLINIKNELIYIIATGSLPVILNGI